MTLQKETRDAIGRTVRSLRELFEGEFGRQASGRFGIRSSPHGDESDESELDAWLDPDESLSLTPAEFAQRNELIHALRYLTSEGNEPDEAVARLIREAAFTAVNRLLAIRVAEAIGVLPAVLSSGRQSAGYRDTVGDLFPGLAHDEHNYWIYVQIAGDELAPAVPRLFDRRHPTSAFIPSRACVDEALELLTSDELANAWQEPESLGWGYQFFNGDDVKQMRDASSAPRNSRELAVRNQFFTPGYVVEWLVQNTLGRRLIQAGYELHLPLLVGEIGKSQPLFLEDVRVLDPAVGSGHFLLGCYDLLERAWKSTGVSPENAAPRILSSLFGVDVDPRAAQVAQAVLLLRARRSAPTVVLKAPTIVTAVALPHSRELREKSFGSLSMAARQLADTITMALDHASELGSLIPVDQYVHAQLSDHEKAPQLSPDGGTDAILAELNAALRDLVSSLTTPEQRLFAAEASDALSFVNVLTHRYDTVLMNPPFGQSVVGESRNALKRMYPDWWTELYACFLTRSFDLLAPSGHIGMVSSSQYFITRTMRDFRALIAEAWPPLVILDLGAEVMHGAAVHGALSVFRQGRDESVVQYRDLSHMAPDSREETLQRPLEELRSVDVRGFLELDRIPFAFHVPDRVLELWSGDERFDPSVAEVRKGNTTFDNFRFLRLRWEVDRELESDWIPYQKGGEYSPYIESSHLLIDWRDDGEAMKKYGLETVNSTAQVLQSSSYWFKPGLTYPHQSSVGFAARILPEGEIFAGEAISIFPRNIQDVWAIAGILNSTPFAEIVRVFGRSRKTENGAVKSMPIGPNTVRYASSNNVDDLAQEISRILAKWQAREETSPHFVSPFAHAGPMTQESAEKMAADDADKLRRLQSEIDRVVGLYFDVSEDDVLDREVARRPELVSRTLRYLQRPGRRWAEDVVSWAVGVAFGRWIAEDGDSRVLLPDPLEAIPNRPPATPASSPVSTLTTVASLGPLIEDVLSSFGANLSTEVRKGLSVDDLAEWLDRQFFSVHLSRYSASRRYAPIYWQLAIPSKRWGLWIYAPVLSRESLFAISRAARDRLSILNGQIEAARAPAAADRKARERAEVLEGLAAEVEKFAVVADEVAQSGWEPDLNDGFVLNAAPLEELFVDNKWRGQIAKHRKAMQKGDYPWATVQREYFEKRR